LKSPLASIQLHLETIRLRRPAEDKLNAFVGTMLADTDRLHYLINNLLMAARLEKRRKTAERRLTDLTVLLKEYVERERDNLPQGGNITLEAETAVKVLVDPEEMGMVLRNLFENAVLYSPGSPDILARLFIDGGSVRLTIQDKGRGLDRKELKKVFDMFYRVHPAGENARGTGLGLYIVDTVVRGSGGSVSVESDGLGRGCTFSISLPVVQ
jgi:signal transduction histidine kinase